MLRYQPPSAPACTQCPAVHTRLDLPGWLTSLITVPEQTAGPSGESKNTFPTGAAFSWYGVFSATAVTGAGSGSLSPWAAEASLVVTVFSASSAECIRSGFQRPSMTGLTKSRASRSHSSLSQSFQPPSRQRSTSMPWSFRRSARSAGTRTSPPASSPARLAVASGRSVALFSADPPQAVAVSASTASSALAARAVRRPRRRGTDVEEVRMLW
ncbi:hypothetical protein RKD35_005209 [Streptomyces albogriseolus]